MMRAIIVTALIALLTPSQRAIAQSATPPSAQASRNQHPQIAGCYDLYYTLRGSEQLVGRITFDTTTTVMQGRTWGTLTFITGRAGFRAPRGFWTWPKPDSVSIRVVFIDSGINFAFPKFAADTMRGTSRGMGLTDTTTTYQARAIKQSGC